MYFEVVGQTKEKLLEFQERHVSGMKSIKAFAKKHGAKDFALEQSQYVQFWLILENPDLKVWKQHKQDKRYCSPRLGCKEGKAIDKEMREICAAMPSGSEIAKTIKMQVFGAGEGGLVWRTPGMVVKKDRVAVKVPDDFKVHASLKKDFKRISDIEYEKLSK